MEKIIEVAKNNVKIVVTVSALGLAVTFGWAKGCVLEAAPETPAATAVSAPAVP